METFVIKIGVTAVDLPEGLHPLVHRVRAPPSKWLQGGWNPKGCG